MVVQNVKTVSLVFLWGKNKFLFHDGVRIATVVVHVWVADMVVMSNGPQESV